jgi:hypothetical protein
MDLEAIAENHFGVDAKARVAAWMAELDADLEGWTGASHIRGENNLQSHDEGRQAAIRLVNELRSRPPGDPVNWYFATITGSNLACKGPKAADDLLDDLCKVTSGWMVWNRLRRRTAPDDTPALRDSARLMNWLVNVVCGPAYLDALDPSAIVSGKVPAVFSTFLRDRDAQLPAGTSATECYKVVGLDPRDPPEPCVLLKYRTSQVGPVIVPTAFDAGTHTHFLPSAAGARYGTTKNLATADGSGGVREVVVPPFPVSRMMEPEFIGA